MIDHTVLYIGVIVFLLLLLAFFGAAETALTAFSKPLMHQMEQDGDRRAGVVNRLYSRKDRLLGTVLLGNTVANILASALATAVAIELAGEAGVAYVTAILTVIVVVFSEILPKTYAIHNANRVAPAIAPAMRAVVIALSPLVHAVQLVVQGLLRLFGANYRTEVNVDQALAEIRGAIEMHSSEDVRQERAMLRSILELDDVEVAEIMTHRKNVAMIEADQPVGDILDQVLESPFTRLPLWRGEHDNVVGVIHAKALLRAVRAHSGDLDRLDILALAQPPWFIPDSTTLLDQLHAFRQRREHFALVVDEYGTLMGVVSLEDILEEIVGDITDEHDIKVTGVRPQADGSYIVNGDVTIRDLNREFDWDLPDDEAATIAGLVLHESRMIPEIGQVFLFHNFRFEVLRRHRNQLTSLRLTPPAGPSSEGA